MNILVLTTDFDYRNGWGRYSRDVSKYLVRDGVTVVPVVSKSAQNTPPEYKKLLPGTNSFFDLYICAPWYAWRIHGAMKGFDAIHCFVEPYSFIAFWLSVFSKRKYILSTHGTYGVLPYTQSIFKRFVHHLSFKRAAKNVCVSNYTKNILETYDLMNLTVINNGVDFEGVDFDNSSIGGREDILLTVGALKRRKGQHVSIEAFAKLSNKYPNLKYVLVGDQSDKKYVRKIKTQIKELKITDKVQLLSNISDHELSNLYKKAKLFLLTSISTKAFFEGFGLVYLEANMYGLPVIGSFGTGAEDAIDNGKTGYLVDQNNPDQIADIISSIISDEQKWVDMSKNCVEWAKSHGWEKIIGEYVRIYKLISGSD